MAPETGGTPGVLIAVADREGAWPYEMRGAAGSVIDAVRASIRSVEMRDERVEHVVVGRDVYEALCVEVWTRGPGMSSDLLTHAFGSPLVVIDEPGYLQAVMSPPRQFIRGVARPGRSPAIGSGYLPAAEEDIGGVDDARARAALNAREKARRVGRRAEGATTAGSAS